MRKGEHSLLLVDDDPTMLGLFELVLATQGWRVTPLNQASQAVECLLSGSYGALLTDYLMPIMDGVSLTIQVRQHPAMTDLPVIILTAASLDDPKLRDAALLPNVEVIGKTAGARGQTLTDALHRLTGARRPASQTRIA